MNRQRLRRRFEGNAIRINPRVLVVAAIVLIIVGLVISYLRRERLVSPIPQEGSIKIIVNTPTPTPAEGAGIDTFEEDPIQKVFGG